WKYSNSGYILLGYIIEQVTGKPYERYLRERIFRPLGMNNTYLGTAEDTLRRRALGYTESETDSTLILPAKPLSMTQPYAAGAMLSTVDDLYTWTKALHSGRVVSAQNMKHLLYPYYLPSGKSAHYAYGLVPRLLLGSFTSEHGGGINGFASYMIYLLNEETCVVVLSNCDCERPSRLAEQIAALVTGKETSPRPIQVEEGKLREYAGVYEQQRSSQRYISFEEGKLYYKKPGDSRFALVPFAPDEFYLSGSPLTRVRFNRSAERGGLLKDMIVSDRSEELTIWERTEKPLPKERVVVEVDAATLDRYTGKYQLMPDFFLHITRQGSQIFVQGTGQPRLALFATSPTRFFLKEVDAEIEFAPGEGPSAKLTLFQAGQELVGERKE
ncbi:MAG TPA: serine hydrolase, partial [Saprospiraceae bacterium]|nr:serine hydrolase [Saprospiraceae bacterium]